MTAGNQLTWKVAGEENVSRYEVERSSNGSETESILVECPFRHEKNCTGQITLQLPAGMKVKEDGTMFRN